MSKQNRNSNRNTGNTKVLWTHVCHLNENLGQMLMSVGAMRPEYACAGLNLRGADNIYTTIYDHRRQAVRLQDRINDISFGIGDAEHEYLLEAWETEHSIGLLAYPSANTPKSQRLEELESDLAEVKQELLKLYTQSTIAKVTYKERRDRFGRTYKYLVIAEPSYKDWRSGCDYEIVGFHFRSERSGSPFFLMLHDVVNMELIGRIVL
jgi:hypothetical protein